MTEYPTTPPPELVQQWRNQAPTARDAGATRERWIARQAAWWGADQELEACCAEMEEWQSLNNCYGSELAEDLRAARRPKPPSLKERALQAWAAVEAGTDDQTAMAVIRRALEALHND